MKRALVPSLRRSTIVPLVTLLGGAIACARSGEKAGPTPERSTTPNANASSSAAATIASNAPSSSSSAGMANPSEPETIVAVASTHSVASCSATAHVTPHIPPTPTNQMLGGKPMPVQPIAPGIP